MQASRLQPKELTENEMVGSDQQQMVTAETKLGAAIGLDLKDEVQLRVNLESEDDSLYVGTIFIGAPHSMSARVVFDTGSEQLAVTGALCDNKTAGKYHFSQEQFSKKINLEVDEPEKAAVKEAVKEVHESQEAAAMNDNDKENVEILD